jgi:hypothetical protein
MPFELPQAGPHVPNSLGKNGAAQRAAGPWLAEESWPKPAWYSADPLDRRRDFEAYFTHELRVRYTELSGDFRSVVGNYYPADESTAQAVFDSLQAVRPPLEMKDPDVLSVSSTLDLVERYMVWLYPSHVLGARVATTKLRLRALRPRGWEQYLELLAEPITDSVRAPLDEAVAACNRAALSDLIGSGLQIRRLRAFRNWGVAFLFLLFTVTPLLVSPSEITAGWAADALVPFVQLRPWVPPLCVLLVGMLGGFLSGLLQARSSRVSLADYQESMLKLFLRPVVGGLISLVLFALLSWKMLPAIDTTSAGSFLLAAFLSGFSERYFLRLLDADEDGSQSAPVATVTGSPGPKPVQTRAVLASPSERAPDQAT